MSAFTPGPYSVLQNDKDDTRVTVFLVVAQGSEKLLAVAKVGRAADAELFAAAPDLLAALEMLAGVVGEQPVGAVDDGSIYALAIAHAAIAKARGGR